MSRHRLSVVFVALCLAACASRSAPATQNTAKVFDAAQSEPKAVEIADAVLAALGGEASWAKAKEIQGVQMIVIDGKLQDWGMHAWDRWNGRHHYKRLYADGNASVSMHELYTETGTAYIEAAKERVTDKEDRRRIIASPGRFDLDTYIVRLTAQGSGGAS